MSGRWRRVLTLAGAAALLVGIIVMLRPFDTRLAVVLDERDMSTAQPCGRPLPEAFRGHDSGGWFAYAPQTGSVFSPGACRAEARRRVTLGAALVGSGVIGLSTLYWRRNRAPA